MAGDSSKKLVSFFPCPNDRKKKSTRAEKRKKPNKEGEEEEKRGRWLDFSSVRIVLIVDCTIARIIGFDTVTVGSNVELRLSEVERWRSLRAKSRILLAVLLGATWYRAL